MKKRPILTAFLILIGICAVFFLMVFGLSHFGDQYTYGFGGDRIGVVKIEGTIVDSEPIIEKIIKFRKSKNIKAIILRINSPGGMVAPSQEIYQEVKKACREKKVVVSMESIAASGGYYIACTADKIVANPGTLVGSIGVILQIENIEELLSKIGLKREIVKSGKYKDIGSMTRPMTEEEEAILQGFSDNIYYQFVDAVAEGRDMKREEVLKLADGRIFTGEQAIKLGLIDRLGNLQDTISMTGEMVGIEGEPKVVYPKKKRPSVFDFIFEEASKSIARIMENIVHDKLKIYYLSTLH
ncbi:MAG: signal peptide peptidase SppA [Deltaproteobacteria bacterium]|jgi:protease-4|nr:signal peptide peptidase SppA [Deltaproteobacteria bacterium]MCK5422330.1 signal peptide peptidase SppA [Deltaproteobacteria bacterium]NOQ85857.1 signal peptide peptidase SppA [Deltaproteobacteria bacterium]